MQQVIVIPASNDLARKERIAAYCRVSSRSDEQEQSLENQTKHYTKLLANREDSELVDIYADCGISGTKLAERTEFCRMLDDCRKGKIDRIITKSVTRFGRNAQDFCNVLRELGSLDVSVYFETNDIDTAKLSTEMMLHIYAVLAEEESRSMSKNQRWSYERRMKAGEFLTCYAPFGYDLVGKTLVPNETQAQTVRRIYAEYLSGSGVEQIVRLLNTENVPKTERHPVWSYAAVLYILRNERYTGDALLQKKCSTDTLPYKKILNKGQRQQYYVTNSHEPLLSKEEYQKVQQLLKSKAPQNTTRTEYPLSKRIICAHCGRKFKRQAAKNGNVYWVCYTHYKNKDNCETPRVFENQIAAAFLTIANTLKANAEHILRPLIAELQELQDYNSRNNSKIGAINLEIARLTEQNHKYSMLSAKGYLDSALYLSKTNEIKGRLAELRSERRRLLADDTDELIRQTKQIIATLDDYDSITEMDGELLDALVRAITVDKNKRITFRLINGAELTERIS